MPARSLETSGLYPISALFLTCTTKSYGFRRGLLDAHGPAHIGAAGQGRRKKSGERRQPSSAPRLVPDFDHAVAGFLSFYVKTL